MVRHGDRFVAALRLEEEVEGFSEGVHGCLGGAVGVPAAERVAGAVSEGGMGSEMMKEEEFLTRRSSQHVHSWLSRQHVPEHLLLPPAYSLS